MSGSDEKLRIQLEEVNLAFHASEARFRNVVMGSVDGIIIVDESGVIKFVNPAAATLFDRAEEKLLGEFFGFPVVAGETTELDIVRKGMGAVVEMRVTITEWVGKTALLLSLRDITDRKRDEEQIRKLNAELAIRADKLESANLELEAFNYTAAHDLRQPLNSIALLSQTMTMLCGNDLQDDCRGYIKEILNITMRMDQLIDDLLKFSRMGHVEPQRKRFDLCILVHEIVTTLKLSDPERPVDFRIADSIEADADQGLLTVVLNNLLGNAWKYTGMRTKAVIEFGATNVGEIPVYFVRDNGVGFAREDAGRLFIPFQRLQGSEQFKGFGIGLATVERIVRRHGGRIWAEGEPDKGATFFFTLAPAIEN